MKMLQEARNWVRDARDFGVRFAMVRRSTQANSTMKLPLDGLGFVQVRPNDSDVDTVRQIFVRGDYDFSRFSQGELIRRRYEQLVSEGAVPVIVDAGANIGAASLWFAKTFPKAVVVAIEPDQHNAALCRANTAGTGTLVLEAAVGARGGRVTLSNPEDKSWAFQTRRVESAEQGVDICTVDQAVKLVGEKARLFIAKIDIEGFESDLFEENLGWLDQADVVIIEPHDWMLPGKDSSLNFRRALMGRPGDMLIAGENLIFIASRLTAADR